MGKNMEILDKIIKYGFLILAFLLPIFFLPLTVFPVAVNKQFLLALFCLLFLILWLIKIVITGKLKIGVNLLSGAVLFFLLVFGVSAIFSLSKTQSFWGMGAEPDVFINLILYALIFFLFANLIELKKDIGWIIGAFLASSGITVLLFLLKIFGLSIFPWDFSQVVGFNPIGTVQALGIFLGGAFVVLIGLIGCKIFSQKIIKNLMIVLAVLLFLTLFIINFRSVWIQILLGMAIIVLGMGRYLLSEDRLSKIGKPKRVIKIGSLIEKSEEFFPLKDFILPLTIIAVALVLVFLRLPLFNVVNIPIIEVSPTYRATFDLAKDTLSESPKNLIIGSGPATFVYKYRLYRTASYNLVFGPNLIFNQGRAALPTFLLTAGILGLFSALLMIGLFIYSGLRIYLGKKHSLDDKPLSRIQMVCFAGGFYFFVSWFFYPLNFVLAFSAFLLAGLWLASLEEKSPFRRFSEISFITSPRTAFFVLLVAVVLIAGSIIGLFTISQKYIAAINYSQGINASNLSVSDLNEASVKIQRAILLDGNIDVYYRGLSQVFILQAAQAQAENRVQDVTTAIDSAQRIAQTAAQINPSDSVNWLQLGSIYENVIPFAQGADEFAVSNYEKAGELDPQNAQIPFNIGRTYLSSFVQINQTLIALSRAEKRDEQKEAQLRTLASENLKKAITYLTKAIGLSPRFSAAYFLLAQAYEVSGDKDLAYQAYSVVVQLEPENAQALARMQELAP